MTNREAYVLGWVFGLITGSTGKNVGGDVSVAPMRPYTSLARVLQDARRERVLTQELDDQIGEALDEVTSIDPPVDGGVERVQPLEVQGSWELGYYAGKRGRPLAKEAFDIAAARRAKKLTQAKLAEIMEVDRAMISRWESGKVQPNAENLRRLKELLA